VRLTVVGCSGSYPGPDSPCSSYLLEHDGHRLLLDMGNGALGALHRHIDPVTLDAVVLSHLHSDHCIDLATYYVVRNYHPAGRLPLLPLHGPAGTLDRLTQAYGLDGDVDMAGVYDFREVTPGTFDSGPFRITADRVNHPVESFAYRIEAGGKVLTYSGDSAESENLIRLAQGSDLFLCEASFTEGRDTYPDVHLNGREAGEHATRAGATRLLLTHIPPWTDGQINLAHAKKAYDGPVELARPDAVYEV
jgi:ribonuclease BN (tRNA processing enzyme)